MRLTYHRTLEDVVSMYDMAALANVLWDGIDGSLAPKMARRGVWWGETQCRTHAGRGERAMSDIRPARRGPGERGESPECRQRARESTYTWRESVHIWNGIFRSRGACCFSISGNDFLALNVSLLPICFITTTGHPSWPAAIRLAAVPCPCSRLASPPTARATYSSDHRACIDRLDWPAVRLPTLSPSS